MFGCVFHVCQGSQEQAKGGATAGGKMKRVSSDESKESLYYPEAISVKGTTKRFEQKGVVQESGVGVDDERDVKEKRKDPEMLDAVGALVARHFAASRDSAGALRRVLRPDGKAVYKGQWEPDLEVLLTSAQNTAEPRCGGV